MGIIAWIILGLAAGMIATKIVGGRDRQGLIITTAIGIGGALLGGFIAAAVFDVEGTQGFFNASTWITAILGATALLFGYHQLTARPSRRRSRRGGRRTSRR